jgi:ASPIC and UnbV/FG-GAP-like repeat/Secretion system C-terminal sorting domain
MKIFIRSVVAGAVMLLLGFSVSNAQEVTFASGPSIPSGNGANGGFAWGDINGDGNLDVFTPSTAIAINNITTFTAAVSTMTANLPINTNDVGALLADFNGDGVLDLFTTNGGTPASGLYYNTGGVFTLATGTGDLATAGPTGEVFQGLAAAPIDHSNYLSVAWPGTFTNIASNNPASPGGGIWLLKGGSTGFTDIGKGATSGNYGIDTSLSYESWDVRFLDANNDGYEDLLMPSFRNGFSRVDTGSSGARKGCVLFLNDGTGKFYVPTSATITGHPTIYALDSIKLNKAGTADSIEYASVRTDTGIIVDDTVRHFSAIGEQWGDLNNDGIEDLILNGLNLTDNRDGNGKLVSDVILYGNGDGTFTYKWNGVNVVANNGITQATNQRAMDIGDYNNDGWADIYASGTFASQHLYRNNGDGTFTDVATQDALTAGGQRAGQFVDYNNDGFLDVYMYTGGNSILQKNNGNGNHWIGFTPTGTGHNMSAIGARFTVYTGATKQIRDIKAEGGSAGMGGSLRANFGLGSATKIDSVNVRWPDGTSHTYNFGAASNTLAINRYYTVQEGSVIPSAPSITRPSWAAHDTSLSSTDTLSWSAATSGTGSTTYTVQIASNASFSSIAKTVSPVSGTSTIVRLGLSTKYYWRVQASDNQFPGVYSAADSFRTQVVPDTTTPKQVLPANNSTTVSSKNAVLAVNYVSTASTYHFQLDSSSTAMAHLILNDSTSDFDTTWTIAATLKAGKTYYWRERGYNPAGSSPFSPVDSFTVMYIPATPVLVYPGPGQADVPATSLTFKWNSVAGDTNYVCQFWTFTSGGKIMTSDTLGRHDTTLTVTSLMNRQWYYWMVQSYNQGGVGAFSAVDSFTTVIELAAPPVRVSPLSTTGENRNTTFVWNTATNAEKYHLQVSTDNTFATTAVDTVVEDTTVSLVNPLAATTEYFWRVSSINLGGEGTFSGVAHYTTGTLTGVAEIGGTPREYALMQNYPNPFNPSTTISYSIPKNAQVTLKIYDILGRVVATLVDGIQAPNAYHMEWDPTNLSSGTYILRIQAHSLDGSGDFIQVKKLLYMK